MKRLVALLAFIPAFVHSEERAFTPCPDVGAGQSIRYENGAALLYAETPQAATFMALQPRDKRTGYAWLGIRNNGFSPFNITENDLSAASGGTPLKMIKFAERANEVRKAGKWRAFGAALAAGAGGCRWRKRWAWAIQRGTVYSGGQKRNLFGNLLRSRRGECGAGPSQSTNGCKCRSRSRAERIGCGGPSVTRNRGADH